MKLIHVTPPEVNYHPLYSVEHRAKINPHYGMPNVWNQHGLTPHRLIARVMRFEAWLRHGNTHERRVRVL